MKLCGSCKILKDPDQFSSSKRTPDKLRSGCKLCDAAYRSKNKQSILEYQADYRSRNSDKNKEYQLVYRQEHRNSISEYNSFYNNSYRLKNSLKLNSYGKIYRSENKGTVNSFTAKYRASKLKATPKWLTQFDLDYIKMLYIQAKELEKLDGIKYHVDHIIPLQGENVCGLHVPWNLQIIEATENLIKSNKI